MIFRKPYALFIKYFRVLHGVLTFLIFLLFFCSISLYRFFRIYSVDFRSALTDFSASNYLNIITFIELFFTIALFIIFLVVMIYKDKPKNVYIFGLLTFIYTFVFYYLTHSTLNGLNTSEILSVAVSKAYRDFAMIAAILQFINFYFILVRAIGFDIKKFDFSSDLHSMNISEKDSEEIEVALNLDKNKAVRKIRFFFRNFKYFYFEHKFIINTLSILLIAILSIYVYLSGQAYYKNYNQGQPFDASGFTMNVQWSYLLDTDSKGSMIVDTEGENPGVILAVRFQTKSSRLKQKFSSGLVTLKIGEFKYRPNLDHALVLNDIGEAYVDQMLTEEYETYLLAFEIPSKFASKKMQLKVNDSSSYVGGISGAKNYYVNLEPEDLRKSTDMGEYKLGDDVNFSDSVLSASYLKIDGFEVNNKFQLNYNYCYKDDKCIASHEYLTPTATGNYFKTLLKLSGSYSVDKKLNIRGLDNILYFLNDFGYISYRVNGELFKKKINSQLVKPISAKTQDCFIEVPYEVMNANEIFLTFNIREKIYKYILK